MTRGPIRLDRSTSSGVVIVCELCPWWSAFRFTISTAEDCACEHEERVHPELTHRRGARRKSHERATRRGDREKSRPDPKV